MLSAVGARIPTSAGCGLRLILVGNQTAFLSSAVETPQPVKSSEISVFRKGTGGRASFSGDVVTIFGATARNVGRSVVNRFLKNGSQVIIPYRCDPYYVRDLKVMGELGQILFFPFDLKDEASIRKVLRYSNVVVNLIGQVYETKAFPYEEVHVEGARRIARIARESGVERFVHVSALNADPSINKGYYVKKGSGFLRSKGQGEIAVRDAFPTATIIRPAVMYGECDRFIWHYVSRYRKMPYDWVQLYKKGEHTYKMPIYYADVAAGIHRAAFEPSAVGETYEFVGPHCYQLSELIDYFYKRAFAIPETGFHFRRHHWPDPLWEVLVRATELFGKFFKTETPLYREWMEVVEVTSDVLTGAKTLADLGVTRLAEVEYRGGQLAEIRSFFKYHGRFPELPPPPLPIRSPPIVKGADGRAKPRVTVTTESKPFAFS